MRRERRCRIGVFGLLAMYIVSVSGCSGVDMGGNAEYLMSLDAYDCPYEDFIMVDVFDYSANYQGIQSGWFGEVVRRKFNMELNIIAPNIARGGDTLFEVRAAAGNLGDLIICKGVNGQLEDLVNAGLLYDMEEDLKGKSIMKYADAIENLNSCVQQGGVYAIPSQVSVNGPNVPSEGIEPVYGPYIRWDLYKELGYPEIDTIEDLLPVLKQMQERHPTAENGAKTYGFSFFRDWDDNMMNAVKQPCCMYGYDEYGVVLGKADGSDYQSIIDDDSVYVRMLNFFYEANQMGLIDPESTTQDYDTLYAKYQDGAVLYCPWAWYGKAAYNTTEHLNAGKAMAFVPIEDMQIYSYGCYPQGNANDLCIMIGKDAEDPQRIMDFIDWMYSPEGINASMQGSGPEGLTWEMKDGRPVLTEFGMEAVLGDGSRVTVPEEWGTGSYAEGKNQLNIKTVAPTEINPDTGVPYTSTMWESILEMDSTEIGDDWKEKMGYSTPMEYLIASDRLLVSPGISVALPDESADVVTIRSQCKSIVVEKSWQMIFAKDEAEFEALLTEMRDTVKGLGYDEIYQIDLENAQAKQVERDKMLRE